MSKRITLTVTQAGTPIEGADVVVGDIVETALTTDENGTTAFLVPDDFDAYAHVLAVKEPDLRVIGYLRLQAGESYEITA